MDRLPNVLTTTILPPAELAAARLDGELFAVDEGWICADEPENGDVRAAVLAALLPVSASTPRLVMMGLTAAWLHGVTDAPPSRHEICACRDERASLHLPRRFVIHELSLAHDDECRVGGLRVTTPARTAFDLARGAAPADAQRAAIDALVSAYGLRRRDVANGIRDRLPGARRAIDRIEAVRVRSC